LYTTELPLPRLLDKLTPELFAQEVLSRATRQRMALEYQTRKNPPPERRVAAAGQVGQGRPRWAESPQMPFYETQPAIVRHRTERPVDPSEQEASGTPTNIQRRPFPPVTDYLENGGRSKLRHHL